MGILQRLKGLVVFGESTTEKNQRANKFPEQYNRVLLFNKSFANLLAQDAFIARSDYKHLIEEYRSIAEFYNTLQSSGQLKTHIKENRLNTEQIKSFLDYYNSIEDLSKESKFVKLHNDRFVAAHLISEKEYLDRILKECDPNISLDDQQREVVLSDEDHTLVIAGAGAGKTTTVAAKVRYLVEKRHIDPRKILVISFTNKAVGELRERIKDNLHIDCPITTFHSTGYAIMKKTDMQGRRIVESSYMYSVINDYLKTKVLRNPQLLEKLILFFGSYFSAPYEDEGVNEYFSFVAKADFSTLKSNLHEYIRQIVNRKTRRIETINSEVVRSAEEVRIANFLYLNGIEYEYEPVYQYKILDANKPYTPDFKIWQEDKVSYIEHFGITEDGKNARYSQDELQKYKSRVNEKILLHRNHKTDLIYTFSKYNDGQDFLSHLQEQLLKRGYELNKKPAEQVYKKLLYLEESKYITKLTWLLCNFINNFKTQGYKAEQFDEFTFSVKNVRTRIFLEICSVCYLEYQQSLKENNCIDFQDMINESAELIRKKQIAQEQLDFKYIIVDEYQDISRQRYNLIRELSKLSQAKIVAVGDDWQSIYAFSGSILPLFTRFCQEVGYGQELKITRTYRNAQEVINIAGNFIQKNSTQIKKELISPKRITNPVIISTYSEEMPKETLGGVYKNLGQAVNNAIGDVLEFNKTESKARVASILLVGRYGFDAKHLCKSKEFTYDEISSNVYSARYGASVKLQFLTAHSSKGLSAENVIIINAKDTMYGFPSKIDDDPVLNLVTANDQSYNYAEERRLFYVALTRTKNRVFIVTPERRPSEFIRELLSDTKSYPNVTLKGELKVDPNIITKVPNSCPICGYPMQLRWNKNYGLRLWICTNDQEICGFMTNDRRGGELSIQKCDWCEDGYLVVKPGKDNFFLGCTNYKEDKSGCNRTLNHDHFVLQRNNKIEEEETTEPKPSYFKEKSATVPPEMLEEAMNKIQTLARKKPFVNTVIYTERYIEKDGFYIVADNEGNELTDMQLLKRLRELRLRIAKERKVSAFVIMRNTVLVRLATDMPITREEYLKIKGIGEAKYKAYGELFIQEIKSYLRIC